MFNKKSHKNFFNATAIFEETPASSLTEANYRAAMNFAMQRMNPGTKRSKKWLSFFQSAACAKAGFEVQRGLGYSDAGVVTGIRCTKETKWSDHSDAFSRHVNLFEYPIESASSLTLTISLYLLGL